MPTVVLFAVREKPQNAVERGKKMGIKKVIKIFNQGNVCVTGLRGRGKDMLMANVISRRKSGYISNVDYKAKNCEYNKLDIMAFDTHNSYDNFINGNVSRYVYPYKDGTDIYISDVGVYFPAQYSTELDKKYGSFAQFEALSRQLGECNVHINVQNLNRAWNKIREQSDKYIYCDWCKVFGGIVIQHITLYERYEACAAHVPKFPLRRPFFNAIARTSYDLQKASYDCSYGKITPMILIYRNKSKYNTRIFKEILENGKT